MSTIAAFMLAYILADSIRQIFSEDREILEDYADESDRRIEYLESRLQSEIIRRKASDRRVGKSISFKINDNN